MTNRRIWKPAVGRDAESTGRGVTLDIARQVEPRWNPGTLKMVGAAGFEPATPCAQGKPRRAFEVLILERFAALENSWAHFWAHAFGDALFLTASEGEGADCISFTACSRTTSRHPHDFVGASRRDGNLDLLARGHEIFLQQVRVMRFGDGDTGVPEDFRKLVDIATRLEPSRPKRVAQCVRRDDRDLHAHCAFSQHLSQPLGILRP